MASTPPAQAPLGEGMARDAARKLRARKGQLDSALEEEEDGAPQKSSGIPEAGGKGFFKPRTPEEKAASEKKLQDMLKNRK